MRVLFAACLMLLANVAQATCTAAITAARTSGTAPLAVFFDATSTDCSTTSNDFHDVSYVWDFDDASAGNWTVFQGMPTHSKNAAWGPVAAHVFDTAGTYDVVLTVTDGTSTDTETVQITVSDPDTTFSGTNTICVGSSFTGCPSGASQVSSTSWATVASNYGAGKRVLVERGATYSASADTTFTGDGGTVGAYGSGADPIVSMSGNNTAFIVGTNTDDLRVMDIVLDGNGTTDNNISFGSVVTKILFYGVTAREEAASQFNVILNLDSAGAFPDQMFFVDCTFTDGGYVWYGGGKRMAFMGTEIANSSGSGGHNQRVTHADLFVYTQNYNHDSNDGHLLKFHGEGWDSGSSSKLGYAEYSGRGYIGQNVFGGNVGNSIGLSLGAQNDSEDERVKDMIMEGNFFYVTAFTSAIWPDAAQLTIRNNIMHAGTSDSNLIKVNDPAAAGTLSPTETIPRSLWVYNNSMYSGSVCSGGCNGMLEDTVSTPSSIARNNVLYVPSSTGYFMTLGMSGWTTSDNTKTSSNPFTGTPSSSDPTTFSINSGSALYQAGTAVSSVLRDFDPPGLRPSPPSEGAYDVTTEEGGGGGGGSSFSCSGCRISDAGGL